MNGKMKKIGITFFTILDIVLLLVLMTWAWIEGTSKPGMDYSNMQVSTALGLAMHINGTYSEVIDLNKYLREPEGGLTLAEASSGDGTKLFFRLPNEENQNSTNDEIYLRDYDKNRDDNQTHLNVTFTLTAMDAPQVVWIDREKSYIRDKDGNALNAVRMSLQVKKMENGSVTEPSEVVILSMRDTRNEQKGAIDFDRENNKMIDDADGAHKYMTTVNVLPLTGYSQENPWYRLDKDQTIQVTMRVWLEGMDEECKDSIAGSSLDLHLYFDAASVGA